jgi:hypothetical protein
MGEREINRQKSKKRRSERDTESGVRGSLLYNGITRIKSFINQIYNNIVSLTALSWNSTRARTGT